MKCMKSFFCLDVNSERKYSCTLKIWKESGKAQLASCWSHIPKFSVTPRVLKQGSVTNRCKWPRCSYEETALFVKILYKSTEAFAYQNTCSLVLRSFLLKLSLGNRDATQNVRNKLNTLYYLQIEMQWTKWGRGLWWQCLYTVVASDVISLMLSIGPQDCWPTVLPPGSISYSGERYVQMLNCQQSRI